MATTATRARVQGVDLLRGLVIVLMALDHVRDYYSPTPFRPEDLEQATPALFLTRWITHFCAPTFVFLAGTSAWLYRSTANLSKGELSRFLATRGLWLVFLELAVVNPSWDANFVSFFFLQVIWAIGTSMLVLAVLVLGPRWLALAFGLLVVPGHNLLDPLVPQQFGSLWWAWTLLHEGGFLSQQFAGGLLVVYPMLPWWGVMALGYGLSPWLVGERRDERRLVLAGLAMVAAFVLLRLTNTYGDASTWAPDARGALWSVLGALNVQKYPPSLLFLLMTLGPALLLLVAFEHVRGAWTKPLAVFGRVPMFFYLIHVPIIMLSAAAWATLTYGQVVNFFAPGGIPAGYSPSLPRAYLVWALLVLALYPLCRWYDRYKRADPEQRWLRFL
jgi:uncharacterized membrane protein